MSYAESTHGGIHNRTKKRRRWSTFQEEPAPNRFGGKVRILGRHSSNSLASFHSKSNPIFEPAAAFNPHRSPQGPGSFHSQRNPLPVDSHVSGGGLRSWKSRQPSLQKVDGDGESWEVENVIGKTSPLPPSPSSCGGGWVLEDTREPSRSTSARRTNYDDGWQFDGQNGNTTLSPTSPIAIGCDGTRSIDGGDGLYEELGCLQACERRSRELVEKVRANTVVELAQLRAYMAVIDRLKAESVKHEAAAKHYAELHREIVDKLLAVHEENSKLERERDVHAANVEEFKQKLGEVESLRDVEAVAKQGLQLQLDTVEKDRDAWKKKVETLESERDASVAAMKKEYAILLAIRDGSMKPVDERDVAVCAVTKEEMEPDKLKTTQTGTLADLVACRAVVARLKADSDKSEAASKILAEAQTMSSGKIFESYDEIQEQLSSLCEEKDKLQRKRNDLQTAVIIGDKRVEDARKKRDAAVLAVRSEWDVIKVELHDDKEKLTHELEAVRQENTKLQSELNAARICPQVKNKKLGNGRNDCRKLGNERDPGIHAHETLQKPPDERDPLQTVFRGRKIKSKRERNGTAFGSRDENKKPAGELEAMLAGMRNKTKKQDIELVELRNDSKKLGMELVEVRTENKNLGIETVEARDANQKLENELVEVRDENKILKFELGEARDGKRKLEIELVDAQDENRKLGSERESLIAALLVVREGNKKLECELVVIQEEKANLEREKEALLAREEQRQKREGERDAVFKSMWDENKKLESEREVLISARDERRKLEGERDSIFKSMQAHLQRLQIKPDLVHILWDDENKGREDAKLSERLVETHEVVTPENERDAALTALSL